MVTHHRQRTYIGCGACLYSDNLFCGLGVLPIIAFVLVTLGVFISYGIAVGLGHVDPIFPYVSYLGSRPPEGNIFAQCINTAAVIVTAMIYIRFLQIDYEYMGPDRDVIKIVNKVAAWIGLTGAFCFSMVANFPDIYVYHIDDVHDYSSIIAFTLDTVYFYLQSFLSYKARGHMNGTVSFVTRLVLSVSSMVLLIITASTGKQSYKEFHGKNDKWWGKQDGGYTLHIVSAVCEWLMVFTMLSFYLTFIPEFKRNHLIPLFSPRRGSEHHLVGTDEEAGHHLGLASEGSGQQPEEGPGNHPESIPGVDTATHISLDEDRTGHQSETKDKGTGYKLISDEETGHQRASQDLGDLGTTDTKLA